MLKKKPAVTTTANLKSFSAKYTIKVKTPTLDDVYLKYTGKRLEDE